MARKVTKKMADSVDARFQKLAEEHASSEKEYLVHCFDDTITIKIKESIPAQEIQSILDEVETMFYANENYTPFFGQWVLYMLLFNAYSGMPFTDINTFRWFCNNAYVKDEGTEDDPYVTVLNEIMPREFWDVVSTAYDIAASCQRKYMIPEEERLLLSSFADLVGGLNTTLANLEVYFNKASEQLQMEGNTQAKDILEAMRMISQKDEKKIAEAVMDFQKEKAKRVARKEPTE